MMKIRLIGGAFAAALCVGLVFDVVPSFADRSSNLIQQNPRVDPQPESPNVAPPTVVPSTAPTAGRPVDVERLGEPPQFVPSASESEPTVRHFVATAYSLRGRTASGRRVSRGVIAADRRLLPLGTRVRLEAGPYTGEYIVADTGGAVRGRKIDIWVPSTSEAVRFGRRRVKLVVLQRPVKTGMKAKKR
ncbi:MAG: hypothetical protein C4334_06850 [Pyrinomonas sp.]|uniref:3D domain-containing protein n=1 Tax=Pyrinomonas sp. TaxID=2080306 RepID=UPI00332CADBC